MARKPRAQVLRPLPHVDEDVFVAPDVVLHPTLSELLKEYERRQGKIRRIQLARFLAAIRAHHDRPRPEHQSESNVSVPAEILVILGAILVTREKFNRLLVAQQQAKAKSKKRQWQPWANQYYAEHPGQRYSKTAVAKWIAEEKHRPRPPDEEAMRLLIRLIRQSITLPPR